jgi:predicted small lipoprotein YifL
MIRLIATALATLTLLAACGRVGPIRPPGPPSEVTYPRTYPSR